MRRQGRCKRLKVIKSCSYGALIFTCSDIFAVSDVSFSHNTLRYRQTDGQTDRHTTLQSAKNLKVGKRKDKQQ